MNILSSILVITMIVLVLWLAGVKEAAAYLEAEVPRWKAENGCYSCHNNGDAARALLLAGARVDEGTLRFLRDPGKWTGKDGKQADTLALVQYAGALAAAGEASGGALNDALRRIAQAQKPDGHWVLDAEAAAGSPVTYGPTLGTAVARRLLLSRRGFEKEADAAKAWLARQQTGHPLDLAALVLALGRKADVEKLAAMQARDGSWNGGEAFDTAVSVLALRGARPAAAERGREWLLRNQLEPGGWAGTTRPAGGQSYAQHISTTAWALQALLPAIASKRE